MNNIKSIIQTDDLSILDEIKDIDYIKQYFLTFDNNLIDTVFDGDIYDKLYEIFKKCKPNGYTDIFFHFDKHNPNIFYDGITGICSFAKLYSKKYDKIIYLLGEVHDPYIKSFVHNKKKYIFITICY